MRETIAESDGAGKPELIPYAIQQGTLTGVGQGKHNTNKKAGGPKPPAVSQIGL
jgi:hypothetical protein